MKTFKCFCGALSVEVDTWFNWYPCEKHVHLTPNQYQDKEKETKRVIHYTS